MKNILWGVLGIIVVVALIFAFKSRDEVVGVDTEVTSTSTPSGATGTLTGVVAKPTSFKSLIALKGNHECKYEQVSGGSRSTNVIYLSDGKLRGEFRTTLANGTSLANLMVYDGVNLYVWKEGMSTGVRTQPKTIAELPDVIPTDITSAAVFGTSLDNVSWDCHAWSAKPSLLVKPSYVKFN